ncbi:MAG TPA: type II CAAX endopeptidase family protein [Allosphingosinicella sp.]|jgi:membrane protease YdiL (CAAX protease family)
MNIAAGSPIAIVILAVLAAALIWFVKVDCADYAAFKKLERAGERHARFRAWVIRSLLLFTLTSVAALALVGRLESLWILPPEFAGALPEKLFPKDGGSENNALLAGMGAAMALGALIAVLIPKLFGSKRATIVDIDVLMPRDKAEQWLAVGLSFAAGIGEEIYFRLMLPLILVLAGLEPMAAFAISAAVFGLVHLYQGWKGVLATAVLGAFLSVLYVRTGALWLVVAVHILIDLNGLLLQPFLRRLFGGGRAADQPQT